jgi:hypothetical protein
MPFLFTLQQNFMKRLLAFSIFFTPFHFCSAQELFRMPANTRSTISSFENLNGEKGQGGKTNQTAKGNAFESIKSGETKTLLNVKTAGTIQRIWITIGDRSPEMLRSLHLQMFWDDALQPAVDVPFGDFFCAALGKPVAFQSALFSNPEGRSFNCYIQMLSGNPRRWLLQTKAKKTCNYFSLISIL